MNRTTGYLGHGVNHGLLTNQVKALLAVTYGNTEKFGQIDPEPLLAIELNGKGQYAFVNHEGVGSSSDDNDKVELWVNTNNYAVMIPLELSATLLMSMVDEDDEHDLAEWVRTFGGRLDGNVRLWQNLMAVPTQATVNH